MDTIYWLQLHLPELRGLHAQLLLHVAEDHHHLRDDDRPQKGDVDRGHPEEDDAEAEKDSRLDQRRDRDSPETFRETISDIRHLSLVLINVTAEDDPSQSLQQQSSLFLLQLLAAEYTDIALTQTGDLGQQLLEGGPVVTHQIVSGCSPRLESLMIHFEE